LPKTVATETRWDLIQKSHTFTLLLCLSSFSTLPLFLFLPTHSWLPQIFPFPTHLQPHSSPSFSCPPSFARIFASSLPRCAFVRSCILASSLFHFTPSIVPSSAATPIAPLRLAVIYCYFLPPPLLFTFFVCYFALSLAHSPSLRNMFARLLFARFPPRLLVICSLNHTW